MAKLFKKILGAAAVGTAAAGALYYWKKTRVDTDEFEDDFEDEDFDLDDDLKPAADREYVSIHSAPKGEESEAENDKPADKEEASAAETTEKNAEAAEKEAAEKNEEAKEKNADEK